MEIISSILTGVISGLITDFIKEGIKSVHTNSLDKKIKSKLTEDYVIDEQTLLQYIKKIKLKMIEDEVMVSSGNTMILNNKRNKLVIQAIKEMQNPQSKKIEETFSNPDTLSFLKSKKRK